MLQRHVPPKHDVRWVATYAARGCVAEVVIVPRRFGDAYARGVLVSDDQRVDQHADQHVGQPCEVNGAAASGDDEPPQVGLVVRCLE